MSYVLNSYLLTYLASRQLQLQNNSLTQTYDGDGFAGKAQSSADTDVFAATSSRPQPNCIFTAEEHYQHHLLYKNTLA